MKRATLVLIVAMAVTMSAPAWGATVTLWLDTPQMVGDVATVPLSIGFVGDAGDRIEFFDLNVTDSDRALDGRIDFVLNPGLTGWSELNALADDGVGTWESALGDPASALPPGDRRLGDLLIDLSGLDPTVSYRLYPDGSPWPTTFVGESGGDIFLIGVQSGLTIEPAEGLLLTRTPPPIPEPLTIAGLAVGCLAWVRYCVGRRASAKSSLSGKRDS